jgi:hypothetical protein
VECSHEFTFETIGQRGEERWNPFISPSKPEIPKDGAQLNCPNCNKPSTYSASDLFYRK